MAATAGASYSLLLQIGTPQPTLTPAPTPIPGGGPIQIGQSRTARLAEIGQVDLWTFEARQGEIARSRCRPQPRNSWMPTWSWSRRAG